MHFMYSAGIVLNFSKMIPWIPTFIDGTILTVVMSLVTVILGSIIGLLTAMMKMSRYRLLHWLANIYTQITRGVPLMVQLFIWLFGLKALGISLPSIPAFGDVYGSREFVTAVVALGLNSGAYVCELLRGGLESIDKGQMEAGRSLGLTHGQVMKAIIIPQAVRVILPGLCNEFISMIKESSIVSVVGIFDVMYTYTIVRATSYSIFEPLCVVALIYFFLTLILTTAMGYLEKRLSIHD
ncbi:amino acid ABC transporter permease [Enterococcus nangangensis]